MENLKEMLLLLSDLQELDTRIVNLEQQSLNLPKEIEEKKQEIINLKAKFESEKIEYVRLSSLKKEKESLLSTKETVIAKHTSDLNSVKSNDVYKTCLLEIEKAKADKSNIEDEILMLMDSIDQELINLKQYEETLKKTEAEATNTISLIEQNIKKYMDDIIILKKERNEFAKKINTNILSQYERIRENRNGQGLALLDGDSCTACNMVLRPQLINQATKCQELVYCDNCSRILFNKKHI
ncbi:MAG: C4-type zinc ribbon domain-containing protein [Endomicrobiaceae bacterium]|nr:C4-type zinc ribbon domain-containing protein [Endomicrobiaceae bacterium]